jgi:NAD(P)-dependent dehydrogenase (short-subunit alcohol dehydrogenase family)
MNFDLQETTVIVTGSSGGIGTALVRSLAEAGATVIGIDIVPPSHDKPHVFIEGDVREPITMQRALPSVTTREWCFVPCAAVGALGEASPTVVLDVNFTAALANATAAVAGLGRHGSIVFVGSVAAMRYSFASSWTVTEGLKLVPLGGSVSREAAYALSKWALARAIEYLAASLASTGLRVNQVVLGPTDTPLASQLRSEQPERWDRILREIPFGGLNRVEDPVTATLFLLSPHASRITGSTIYIDGGWTACQRSPSE